MRFLDTSSKVYLHSSFLFLPNPFDRTFSPFRSIPHSYPVSTEGRFPGSPVRPREGQTLILITASGLLVGGLFRAHINHNGPAIWGGCVTRRSIRAGSCYFSQKVVTVQGGYGALFAVQVQILLSITRVAVQV